MFAILSKSCFHIHHCQSQQWGFLFEQPVSFEEWWRNFYIILFIIARVNVFHPCKIGRALPVPGRLSNSLVICKSLKSYVVNFCDHSIICVSIFTMQTSVVVAQWLKGRPVAYCMARQCCLMHKKKLCCVHLNRVAKNSSSRWKFGISWCLFNRECCNHNISWCELHMSWCKLYMSWCEHLMLWCEFNTSCCKYGILWCELHMSWWKLYMTWL